MEETSLARVMRDGARHRVLDAVVNDLNASVEVVMDAYLEQIMIEFEYVLGDWWGSWHVAKRGQSERLEFEWFLYGPPMKALGKKTMRRNAEIEEMSKRAMTTAFERLGWNVTLRDEITSCRMNLHQEYWVVTAMDFTNYSSPFSPQRALRRCLDHRSRDFFAFHEKVSTAAANDQLCRNFWPWMQQLLRHDYIDIPRLFPADLDAVELKLDAWASQSGWRVDVLRDAVDSEYGYHTTHVRFTRTKRSMANLVLVLCASPAIRFGGFGDVLRVIAEYVHP